MDIYFRKEGKLYEVDSKHIKEVSETRIRERLLKLSSAISALPKEKTLPDNEAMLLWNRKQKGSKDVLEKEKLRLENLLKT